VEPDSGSRQPQEKVGGVTPRPFLLPPLADRAASALAVLHLDPGVTPELAIAGERFALIESNRRCWGPNGVSEWVWQAGASRM
jgi:hypothetical protein